MSHASGTLLFWICNRDHSNEDKLYLTSYVVTCAYCLTVIDKDMVYGWTELGHECQGLYGPRPTPTRVWCRPCGRIHTARELTNCICLCLEDNDRATSHYFRCAPRMVRILPRL